MRGIIRILSICLVVSCGLLLPAFDVSAAEKTIYTSPYVSVTEDGMAWTTNPGDRDVQRYPLGDRVETGLVSSLRALEQGEHYYKTKRPGNIPVGYWKVRWELGQCVHNGYPPKGSDYHGIPYGRKVCQRLYYSGWTPYCADCGEMLDNVLFYMSREAAATIDHIQMGTGMSYYYLCPFCSNLEQARGLNHSCKAISCNQYRVQYDANCDRYGGYMRNSIHMYQNAEVYEGSPVTPETHLSWNSYLRTGYVFTGWNTEPDGTGTGYADGEEVWNLTDCDYHIDPKAGTVVLYAQWRKVESTLYIDPNGGKYQGNAGVTAVTQGYGAVYVVEEGSVEPPPGRRVSFQCNGGREVPDITGTMHFTEWNMETPFHGDFQEGRYTYRSETGDSDLLTACYDYDSITLPATEKQGSSFGGWYFDAEFAHPAGAAGDRITPVTDLTLYAQWVDLTLYAKENYRAYGGKGAVDLSWSQSDHRNKWYLLYQSTDGVNWNRIFRGDDIEKDRTVSFTGSREGEPRTFTIRDTGLYTITAAGAQGSGYEDFAGGQGGSVTASFWLKRGETLTYTVGGADGYNGGGKGDMYADGGGCTVVSSDQKGILLVAGGGGGATIGGPGGAGGSQASLLDTGYEGEAGGAGGGGGYRGGTAGERILHHHTESCYRDSSYDGLEEAVGYWQTEYHVAVDHDDSDDYDCDDCYQFDLRRAGNMADPIPVKGNTSVNVQAILWKQICRNGELWPDSYLRVYDQDGRCFFHQDLSNILHDSNVLERGIIAQQDRAWEESRTNVRFPRFHTEFVWWLPEKDDDDEKNGGYTHYCSIRNSDGTSGVAGEYQKEGDAPVKRLWGTTEDSFYPLFPDYNFRVYGDTGYHLENTPLFFVRDGGCYESGVVLDYTIDIPAGTTGIYVEACSKGGSAISHDIVQTLIARIMLQGGKETICGMTEGQIIASRPSYGGSSYVNEEYAYSYTKESGVQKGDGSFSLQAQSVGYTEEHSLEDVFAPDLASPDVVDVKGVRKEGLAAGKVLVTWEKPADHGTVYYHVAESCFAGSSQILCRSNETANTLTSGVKGYHYCIDNSKDTEATSGDGYTEEPELAVAVGEKTCYLHLSAVDTAGNRSGTIHIPLDADAAARPLHTEPLSIEEEGENIYPAGERRWYVRSDGVTPVTLLYGSYIDGMATERYQINHALFVSMDQEEQASAYNRVSVENQELSAGSIRVPDRLLQLSVENGPLLAFYPYTQVYREDRNRRLSVTQRYTLETAASGKQVEVYPRAGADWAGGIFYSAQEEDRRNGLTLIGDGEPPEIRGMELLQELPLIDRRVNAPVLSLSAWDELSGVREFYLMIYNGDNNCSRKFEPDAAGLIQVELTAEDPLFSGDFTAVAHAVDNVGNETTVSEETTEFGLTAQIERILSPHAPVFQNGESGILSIAVWGYPDYVEIEFPAEMTEQDPGLNRRIEYAGNPRYCQEEEIQFMIPLYTPSNADYTVTVRAYKGNRRLEQYPELSVVEVSGTVLDDFRTRLR